MGDIGDGDDQAKTRPVRFREHGIVEVARVLAVDGDQRDVAQIGAAAERRGTGALGLLECGCGECLGNVVGMNDDEADGSRIAHGAEALDDAGRLEAQTMVRQRFGEHDLAGFRAAVLTGRHHPFRFGAAVGGDDAAVADRRPARGPACRPCGAPCGLRSGPSRWA